MMDKTKIEWADASWNPVSGCLHRCEYCYARTIAGRFAGCDSYNTLDTTFENGATIHELDKPAMNNNGTKAPYPFEFEPTFHRYRLDQPERWTRPRNIFVCSMADLFGKWVPDRWIEEVFKACAKAPQHRYLFLTKNPTRYIKLEEEGKLPKAENMWYGSTITNPQMMLFYSKDHNIFISMEPLLKPFKDEDVGMEPNWMKAVGWVIIGAETGNRKGKITPEPGWVDTIVRRCRAAGVPVLMKDSLTPVIGEEKMLREFPWEAR